MLGTNKGYPAQVYKAKMGSLDVAIKTINRQHVNPQLTSQQALQVMQQVTILQGLGLRNCACHILCLRPPQLKHSMSNQICVSHPARSIPCIGM